MVKRSGIILAVVGCIVFFFCMEGWGAEWRLYAEKTVLGDMFYDTDRITYEPNSIVRVWTKKILSDNGKKDLVANMGGLFNETHHIIEFVRLDCRGRRFDVSQATFYSIDGNVVKTYD
jgi:hypothetical protein